MPTSPPQVLFFCSFPPPYTGQNVSSATFFRLLRGHAETEQIDTADRTAFERERGGLRAELCYTRDLLRHVRALRARVRRNRPDVLYLVLSSSAVGRLRDVLFLAAARPFVGRVVAHVHVGDFHRSLERVALSVPTRYVLRRVDRFLFLSERLAALTRPHLSPEQVAIVPNTIQHEMEVTDVELAEKWALRPASGVLRVAFVSNMIPSKGYMALAEGVAAYNAARPARPAEVDFVGAWPSVEPRSAFEQRLADLGLTPYARVHGPVADRAWVRRLLLDADVLALPTTYPHEAQPLCIIEAFAAGTPVIATAHASIPDYVSEANGTLLDAPSAEAIARALETLADAGAWGCRARAARATFVQAFSEQAVRAAFLRALGIVPGGG